MTMRLGSGEGRAEATLSVGLAFTVSKRNRSWRTSTVAVRDEL